MNNAIKIILGSALVTAAAIKAAPVLAQPAPAESPVAISIVHTGDLDLSSEYGQRRLQTRLAHAAREVCGVASDADLQGKNAVRKCRDDVLSDARAQREQMIAAANRGSAIAITASR